MNIKELLEKYNEFLFTEGYIIDQQLGVIDKDAATEFLAQKQVENLSLDVVSESVLKKMIAQCKLAYVDDSKGSCAMLMGDVAELIRIAVNKKIEPDDLVEAHSL